MGQIWLLYPIFGPLYNLRTLFHGPGKPDVATITKSVNRIKEVPVISFTATEVAPIWFIVPQPVQMQNIGTPLGGLRNLPLPVNEFLLCSVGRKVW